MKKIQDKSQGRITIPDKLFFKIGDVAEILGVKTYVIRFWETEFPFLVPEKSEAGQRVYKRQQIESLALIQHLLHVEKYSIEGARLRITELRKTGSFKAAINSVIAGSEFIENKFENKTRNESASNSSTSVADPGLKVEGIKKKISELRRLIREPGQAGLTVPELSWPDSNQKSVPSEPKAQG